MCKKNNIYFCDHDNCSNGTWSNTGDGWNEPFEYEFECLRYGEIYFDTSDNKLDNLCPLFNGRT